LKAIICTKYGPPEVLELAELPKPVPRNSEVLIRLRATAVTGSDCLVRGFKIPAWHPMGLMMGLALGFGKPRKPVLGMVVAGDIEAIGPAATKYRPGDRVFGMTMLAAGTYAEYCVLGQNKLITAIPPGTTFEDAAAVPYGGLLALSFLKNGDIRSGWPKPTVCGCRAQKRECHHYHLR
jgi:NADPH:quinone reductase-like Zn-dependent oxidoreductase